MQSMNGYEYYIVWHGYITHKRGERERGGEETIEREKEREREMVEKRLLTKHTHIASERNEKK